jgi:transcription elongation factor Elf1
VRLKEKEERRRRRRRRRRSRRRRRKITAFFSLPLSRELLSLSLFQRKRSSAIGGACCKTKGLIILT